MIAAAAGSAPLAGWRLWRKAGLSGALGVVMAAGLAPWGVWPLTLVGLVCLPVLLLAAVNWRQATVIGWALGTGYFAFALLWIVEPFLVDPDRHGWMAPFALVFLSGGLALFWAAAFGVARRLFHRPLYLCLGAVLTLSLAEFARAYVLTGFPWAALAQIWVSTEQAPFIAQLLAWIGPQGLALATLLATVLPGVALLRGRTVAARAAGLIPPLALAGFGFLAASAQPATELTDTVVRLVQPNAPQHEKWDPDRIPVFFDRQVRYTAAAPRPDLIVWSETAVPSLLENAEPAFDVIADAAAGTPVAVGIQRREEQRYYNALVLLDETGALADLYDKHHLVPFGEYIPLGDLAARVGLQGFAAREGDGFSAGPGPELLDFGPIGRGLPLICYEAVFPQDLRKISDRADFLLQVTNDGWFGEHSGPYQHLAQARMRAIEQGLPMVRVANTGISAMIDPTGRILDSLPLGEAGYIDARLPVPAPPTVYFRTGDSPVFLLLLFALAALLALQTRSRRAFSD